MDYINRLKLRPEQLVYRIECQNPFIIQDAAHLGSIVTTSMSTTRYVQTIINGLQGQIIKFVDVINAIRANPIDNLALLWHVVFLRSNNQIGIDKQLFEYILSNYVWDYFTDTGLSARYLSQISFSTKIVRISITIYHNMIAPIQWQCIKCIWITYKLITFIPPI